MRVIIYDRTWIDRGRTQVKTRDEREWDGVEALEVPTAGHISVELSPDVWLNFSTSEWATVWMSKTPDEESKN